MTDGEVGRRALSLDRMTGVPSCRHVLLGGQCESGGMSLYTLCQACCTQRTAHSIQKGERGGTPATIARETGGVRIACAGCGAWWGFVAGVAAVTDGEVIARWYCCGRGADGRRVGLGTDAGQVHDEMTAARAGASGDGRGDDVEEAMEVVEEARADEMEVEAAEAQEAGGTWAQADAGGGMFSWGIMEEVADFVMADCGDSGENVNTDVTCMVSMV